MESSPFLSRTHRPSFVVPHSHHGDVNFIVPPTGPTTPYTEDSVHRNLWNGKFALPPRRSTPSLLITTVSMIVLSLRRRPFLSRRCQLRNPVQPDNIPHPILQISTDTAIYRRRSHTLARSSHPRIPIRTCTTLPCVCSSWRSTSCSARRLSLRKVGGHWSRSGGWSVCELPMAENDAVGARVEEDGKHRVHSFGACISEL